MLPEHELILAEMEKLVREFYGIQVYWDKDLQQVIITSGWTNPRAEENFNMLKRILEEGG